MGKTVVFAALLFVFSAPVAYPFDLCPACSPETIETGGDNLSYMPGAGGLSLVTLYRLGEAHAGNHGAEPEQALVSLSYGLTERLKAGLMYGFSSGRPSLQVDFLALEERPSRPGLLIGTGSFRGVFSESSPYLIAMKGMQEIIGIPLKVSAGVKYSVGDRTLEPAANLIVRLYGPLYGMAIVEGSSADAAAYAAVSKHVVAGIRLIDLRTPAAGVVVRL